MEGIGMKYELGTIFEYISEMGNKMKLEIKAYRDAPNVSLEKHPLMYLVKITRNNHEYIEHWSTEVAIDNAAVRSSKLWRVLE
jgi:hypothetical protein